MKLNKAQEKFLAKMLKPRKGQAVAAVSNLAVVAIMFVVVVIVIAIGGNVVNEVGKTQAVNTTARNITDQGLTGLNQFGTFLPIIAIVIVAGVIIAILVGAFAVRSLGGE